MELVVDVLGEVEGTEVDLVVVVWVVEAVGGGEGVVEGGGSGGLVVEDFFSCLFKVFCCNLFHQETVVWPLKCFLCEEEEEVVEGGGEVVEDVEGGLVELDWVVVTWFHQVLENGQEMRKCVVESVGEEREERKWRGSSVSVSVGPLPGHAGHGEKEKKGQTE